MNKGLMTLFIVSITILLAGCAKENVSLNHIHGLGYTSDGKTLMIPAHTGLVSYSEDKWSQAEAQEHDYMGFVMVDKGFYSSGHPGLDSKLENPLGIVKSEDMGKTITTLGLQGESDFHLMAASYKTHAIYVFNHAPNSMMDAMGLYFSQDDAATWVRSQMNGISGEPIALATHPTDEKVVVVGTELGLFISRDAGVNFERLLPDVGTVSAVTFGAGGDLFVAAANAPAIYQLLQNGNIGKEITAPPIGQDDVVAYIAQNPADFSVISIATMQRDIFVSRDNGETWKKIADKGNPA